MEKSENNAPSTLESTVFVVDDDGALRHAVSDFLQAVGLNVAAYSSAEDFLKNYDPEHPGCLVLDLKMPGMGGLELQASLGLQDYTLPIIIVTGYADVPVAVRTIHQGAMHLLEKPYEPDVLLALIQSAIEKDRVERAEYTSLRGMASRLEQLSQREREVMARLIDGQANNTIAEQLGISTRTVEAHRARVMRKTQADSVAELVRMGIVCGIPPINTDGIAGKV
jgi:FixJ family two-component response regulator